MTVWLGLVLYDICSVSYILESGNKLVYVVDGELRVTDLDGKLIADARGYVIDSERVESKAEKLYGTGNSAEASSPLG